MTAWFFVLLSSHSHLFPFAANSLSVSPAILRFALDRSLCDIVRSLRPVSPSGQRCLVTPGWNLPLQGSPIPYQRRVLVHEWVRSAIHSSPQLTSPMVSHLWNFHHCLVRYYWYVTVCFGILLHALVWFDLNVCCLQGFYKKRGFQTSMLISIPNLIVNLARVNSTPSRNSGVTFSLPHRIRCHSLWAVVDHGSPGTAGYKKLQWLQNHETERILTFSLLYSKKVCQL